LIIIITNIFTINILTRKFVCPRPCYHRLLRLAADGTRVQVVSICTGRCHGTRISVAVVLARVVGLFCPAAAGTRIILRACNVTFRSRLGC
jgi:hypothetical protein